MLNTITLRKENDSVLYVVCDGEDVLRLEQNNEALGGVYLSTAKPLDLIELLTYGLIVAKISDKDIRELTDAIVDSVEDAKHAVEEDKEQIDEIVSNESFLIL